MTNYLMSNKSFFLPTANKPLLSHLIFLYSQNKNEAEELASQIGFFGYQVQIYEDIEGLQDGLRWSTPNAILLFMDDIIKNEDQFDDVTEVIQSQAMSVPTIVISPEDNFFTRLKVVRSGGQAFFVHPVDISAMIGALDEISNPNSNIPFRILIIEDALTQASFYAMHLEKVGMETRIVTDPIHLMEPLLSFNPDLILMDMYLPDCSGMEIARLIRQMENYVSVPIVYLSAETDKERQLAAMFMGGDDFLIKPIKPEHLISAVSSRVERYRKLRTMMTSDGLTGLLNHTTIKERLEKEIQLADQNHMPLCYAMIDLDYFKDVNDRHGHAIGDKVLKSLARMLRQRLRRTDLIGRYGGEEFAIIFPNTFIDDAVSIMGRLREGFSKVHHRGADGTFSITYSCGVADYPRFRSASKISLAADRALYEAKHAGRNKVLKAKD